MKDLAKIIFVPIIFLNYSCQKSTDKNTVSTIVAKVPDYSTVQKNNKKKHVNNDLSFSVREGLVSDIVPNGHEIQHQTEGDLDNNGLSDKVLVVRKKSDTLAQRTVLVLLKTDNKTFKLDKISNILIPDEYNEVGFKKYDTENISIENGNLSVKFYNPAPYGNIFFDFKYIQNDLVLTYIETYNVGAGSWQSLFYEPLKGKFTQEVTNTMEEDMPSETKNIQVKKQKFLFENSSPDDIISKVYSENDVL